MAFWSSDEERVSGAAMEGDFNGVIIRGLQKLDVSDEVTRDPMYGNDKVSIGMPGGTHKGEFTLESIPEEVDEFLNSLGDTFYNIPGTIGIQLVRPSGLITYNLTRVYVNKTAVSIEGGGQKGSTGTLTGVILDPIDWNSLRGVVAANQGNPFSFPVFSF